MLKSSVNIKLVETEIAVLRKVGSNPHVAKLLDVFETGDAYFLVMELAKGGELFERLASKGARLSRLCFPSHLPCTRPAHALHPHRLSDLGRRALSFCGLGLLSELCRR